MSTLSSRDLTIMAKMEFQKAIGHLEAGMESLAWTNYHGVPESDAVYEETVRKTIETFIADLQELIG